MTVKESDIQESDTAEVDSVEVEQEELVQFLSGRSEDRDTGAGGDTDKEGATRRLRLSISLRNLVTGAVIIGLAIAVGIFAWLYVGMERKFDAQAGRIADNLRAEDIALNYATNAAAIDFQELDAWTGSLVAGTTPELETRLAEAAGQMQQILVPLEWTSTAQPLVAKVRSDADGIYVVDSFVSVLTATVQSGEPLQSTATYSITIDSNNDWIISDVGGIGAAMQPR